MKKLILSKLLVVMLLLDQQPVIAQKHTLNYRLMKANDSVGEMTVIEDRVAASLTIQTTTKATVPALLFNITMEDQKYIVVINNVLHAAVVSRKFFNGTPEQSKTILSNGSYSDGVKPIPALYGAMAVPYCSTMLYTTEPLNNTAVYSEFHRQFMAIKRVSEHAYCIRFPDGQTGYYYYEKGICVRIVTQTNWATIETVLVNKTLASK